MGFYRDKFSSLDLSNEFAEKMGLSKQKSKEYIDEIFNMIKSHVENNQDVTIKNFGKFSMTITPPKKGRNIITQEPIDIPSKYKISFKMARSLSDTYNASQEKTD